MPPARRPASQGRTARRRAPMAAITGERAGVGGLEPAAGSRAVALPARSDACPRPPRQPPLPSTTLAPAEPCAACLLCSPSGYYAPSYNSTYCMACPAGTFSASGATTCSAW